MKSLELFTGAGGLALGTHLAGFDHVGLLEWNHDACNTLRLNAAANALPGISHWQVEEADIKTVDFARFRGVELVAGGVPCQPFSIGGKHKGMDDSRDMFPDFVRAIRTLQPRAFIVGVHGVPGGENMIAFSDGSVRYLTVREAARVQTFPDRWRC